MGRRGVRALRILSGMRARNAPQPPLASEEVILSNPRGLEPRRSENWADGTDWRDRRGWKLGKLERPGQPERWDLEDRERGSPDHLSAGDPDRQPAEGARRVFLAAFPRWRAGSRECAFFCLPPETLLVGHASQDWAPSPVSGEATLWSLVC